MKILKEKKGITLIALVLTIIVLLILAAVTLNLVLGDNGIITKANIAKDTTTIEDEKEKIGLAYLDYKMKNENNEDAVLAVEGAFVDGNGSPDWRITFENRDQYILSGNDGTIEMIERTDTDKLVEKYVLGKKENDIIDNSSKVFKNDENSITDASTTVIHLFDISDFGKYRYRYIKYNNAVYKVFIDYQTGDTKTVRRVYTQSGREGETVTYNGIEYTILYDNGDTVQMVINSTIGQLALGYIDTNTTGNDNFEKTVYSYNNAITRLNNYCATLIELDDNITDVRSVGSNPYNKNSENKKIYSNNNLESVSYKYNGNIVKVNNIAKSEDFNYEEDMVRMCYFGILTSSDEKQYWIASRRLFYEGDIYAIMSAKANSNSYDWPLWGLISSQNKVVLDGGGNFAVRPVVTIKSLALNSN